MADIGEALPAPSTQDRSLLSPNGNKIDFKIDDGFVDVDTLLNLEDTDALLGTIYSPFRSETMSGLCAPSALESLINNAGTTTSTATMFGSRNFQSPAARTPRHSRSNDRDKLSPPLSDQGNYRRSARLTPSRLLQSPGFVLNETPGFVVSNAGEKGSFASPPLSSYGSRFDGMADIPAINFGVEPYMSAMNDNFNRSLIMGQSKSRSMKKVKKKKSTLDHRSTTAPKRGEYKCGKCGYFPKKAKHNCDEERLKRGGATVAKYSNTTSIASPSDSVHSQNGMDGVFPHDLSPHEMGGIGPMTSPSHGSAMDYNTDSLNWS